MKKYIYDYIAEQEPDGNSEWCYGKDVDEEIERLKKELKKEAKRNYLEIALNVKLIDERDQLKKEKEWLIGNICFNYLDPEITIEEAKKDIIKRMQQALEAGE